MVATAKKNNNTIPEELRRRNQWMTWSYTAEGGKFPHGKSNDPATWTSFSAIENQERIAFTISGSDPYCGIDLDGCIVDGQWAEWCEPIIHKFRGVSYCEVSPSGTGIKFTTRAKKPVGSTCKKKMGEGKQQIECYDHERFWTVTGDVLEGFEAIGDGQAAVDWLFATFLFVEASAVALRLWRLTNAVVSLPQPTTNCRPRDAVF